jgi:endonuclease/exonuclease/phosphatase family metal-dependent hydrolase
VTVASLNTRGIAPAGSFLRERYRAIAQEFEESTVDVVGFQEVVTYHHLNLLTRHLPSFRHVGYRRSLAGPAGGVVVVSRLPVTGRQYHRFPLASDSPGLPWRARFTAPLKGALVIRLAQPELTIATTHPTANLDGDWSPSSRFRALQQRQLARLARIVRDTSGPLVLCGDFNVARDSGLFADFIAGTGLVDSFGGRCPPTFHAEYLGPGRNPQCIDFILASASIRTTEAQVLFAEKHPLPHGPAYLSDHLGLRATLVVPVSASAPDRLASDPDLGSDGP